MIDAGYRGNLKVILHNTQERPLKIKAGDRIGQLFIQKVLPFICVEVDQFSDEKTDRGEGGFGSTGQ
jgi:dUTP pyrophosphatase